MCRRYDPGVSGQESPGRPSLARAVRTGRLRHFLLLEDGMPLRPVGSATSMNCSRSTPARRTRWRYIRGPGTALYGANAVHAIVTYQSRRSRHSAPRTSRSRVARTISGACSSASQPATHRSATAPGAATCTMAASAADSPVEDGKLNLLHERRCGVASCSCASPGRCSTRRPPGSCAGWMPTGIRNSPAATQSGGVPRCVEHTRLGRLEPPGRLRALHHDLRLMVRRLARCSSCSTSCSVKRSKRTARTAPSFSALVARPWGDSGGATWRRRN